MLRSGASGPTSTNASQPCAASVRSAVSKRTGSRVFASQWLASTCVPAANTSPVSPETSGRRRGRTGTRRNARSKSANTGSMRGEWKACETFRARVVTPSAASRRSAARTASRSPETTVCAGPLTAAMETCPRSGSSAAATLSASAKTAAISPDGGSDCIRRARSATSPSPSSSVNAPAKHAAAYSPTLCPKTKSGSTPHARHNSASAYSSAKSAGCV